MMEIKGTLLKVLPVQTGEGKNGVWSKYDIIIQQEGKHAKMACVTIFGDKVSMDGIGIGSLITATVNIESREFNGKYYTNVTAWKIDGLKGESMVDYSREHAPELVIADQVEDAGDLPF